MIQLATSFWVTSRENARRYPKPGEMIERLPDSIRDDLKGLKSEDIENVRVDTFL